MRALSNVLRAVGVIGATVLEAIVLEATVLEETVLEATVRAGNKLRRGAAKSLPSG